MKLKTKKKKEREEKYKKLKENRVKKAIHAGFVLKNLDEIKKIFTEKQIINEYSKFRTDLYFAGTHIGHGTSIKSGNIESWYKRWSGKGEIKGYLSQLYSGKGVIVAIINVSGNPFYVTLKTKENGLPMQEYKRLANSGELGPVIKIDRIEVDIEAYIFCG